jgi:hypothetical protein
VRIWQAGSTFEAELIRRKLTGHGISVLIPGEDFDPPAGARLGNEDIFVPADQRDRALELLPEVWDFLSPPADDEEDDRR